MTAEGSGCSFASSTSAAMRAYGGMMRALLDPAATPIARHRSSKARECPGHALGLTKGRRRRASRAHMKARADAIGVANPIIIPSKCSVGRMASTRELYIHGPSHTEPPRAVFRKTQPSHGGLPPAWAREGCRALPAMAMSPGPESCTARAVHAPGRGDLISR